MSARKAPGGDGLLRAFRPGAALEGLAAGTRCAGSRFDIFSCCALLCSCSAAR